MVKKDFLDLDDLKAPKRTFQLNGKKYEVEPDLPVKQIMQLVKLTGKGDDASPEEQSEAFDVVFKILDDVCPKAKSEIRKLSIYQLQGLIRFLVQASGMEVTQDPKKK